MPRQMYAPDVNGLKYVLGEGEFNGTENKIRTKVNHVHILFLVFKVTYRDNFFDSVFPLPYLMKALVYSA